MIERLEPSGGCLDELCSSFEAAKIERLRDHFAGLVLPNRLDVVSRIAREADMGWSEFCSKAAKDSYDIAEAMLKEREARK